MSNVRKNQLLQRYNVVSSMRGIQNNNLLASNKKIVQTPSKKSNTIESVILDQKKIDPKIDVNLYDKLDRNIQKRVTDERNKYWNGRTNQPYKNIMPLTEFQKEFKKEEDLIVYRVKKIDKDKKILEEKTQIHQQEIAKHNKELKETYADNKKESHREEFEYNHIKKYNVKYDPTEFSEMKDDAINYYKKEQMREEGNKKCIDDIIESMVTKEIIQPCESPPSQQPQTTETTSDVCDDTSSNKSDDNNSSSTCVSVDKYKQRQKRV